MNEESFFQNLYDETYHIITRYVISKCDNISYVEDIVQNVYLKVYEQILKRGVDYFNKPIPLLIKFSKNELFNYYNLKNKLKIVFLKDNDSNILDIISSKENIEQDFIIHSTIEEVWKIVKQSDLETQKIISLYYLEGLSLNNIASILSLNINTTKSKLYRLLTELKKISKEVKVNE